MYAFANNSNAHLDYFPRQINWLEFDPNASHLRSSCDLEGAEKTAQGSDSHAPFAAMRCFLAQTRDDHDVTKRNLARSSERLEDIFSFIRDRQLYQIAGMTSLGGAALPLRTICKRRAHLRSE